MLLNLMHDHQQQPDELFCSLFTCWACAMAPPQHDGCHLLQAPDAAAITAHLLLLLLLHLCSTLRLPYEVVHIIVIACSALLIRHQRLRPCKAVVGCSNAVRIANSQTCRKPAQHNQIDEALTISHLYTVT
jgi:hypothetical protein